MDAREIRRMVRIALARFAIGQIKKIGKDRPVIIPTDILSGVPRTRNARTSRLEAKQRRSLVVACWPLTPESSIGWFDTYTFNCRQNANYPPPIGVASYIVIANGVKIPSDRQEKAGTSLWFFQSWNKMKGGWRQTSPATYTPSKTMALSEDSAKNQITGKMELTAKW